MYEMMFRAHSDWRWIVIALVVAVIVRALIGWLGKQKWTEWDARLLLVCRVAVYLQILAGLVLYIWLQKWRLGMGFTGGHDIPALLGVGGIEFGAARAKRISGDANKFKFVLIGFALAAILIYGALMTVGGLLA